MFTKFLQKIAARKHRKISYSQSGEDIIISFLFQSMKISQPTYIDIGAHDPFYLNNTALFYTNGAHGINIEPNKQLIGLLKKYRQRDINLNICIGDKEGMTDYYMMDIPTLNTASKEEAMRLESATDRKIIAVTQVPVKTMASIINEYNNGIFPDFLTLDVEGLDEFVLKSIEFEKTSPKVICVETLTYEEHGTAAKREDIVRFLREKDYLIYADTYINTIFVRADIRPSTMPDSNL